MMSATATRSHTFTYEDPRAAARMGSELNGLEMMEKIMSGEMPPPPIMVLMNARPVKVSDGRAVFEAEPAEYHFNPLGRIHGGYAATLLDSAMGCAIHTTLAAGVAYTTIEIKINYIRSLSDRVGVIHCEGTAIHVGGRIATAEGRIVDRDGNLYAHGTTTCLIMSP